MKTVQQKRKRSRPDGPSLDDQYLAAALKHDDGRELLSMAIGDLVSGSIRTALAWWLAQRLDRVLNGEDARKVFALAAPEGAPKGRHGAGGFDADGIAAATVLATRRFSTKTEAYSAIADAVGWKDTKRVRRHYTDNGYLLDDRSDDDLIVMAGAELMKRVAWPVHDPSDEDR